MVLDRDVWENGNWKWFWSRRDEAFFEYKARRALEGRMKVQVTFGGGLKGRRRVQVLGTTALSFKEESCFFLMIPCLRKMPKALHELSTVQLHSASLAFNFHMPRQHSHCSCATKPIHPSTKTPADAHTTRSNGAEQ